MARDHICRNFLYAILWFIQDPFGEFIGKRCFMSRAITYLRNIFASHTLRDAWESIDKGYFSLLIFHLAHDLWTLFYWWEDTLRTINVYFIEGHTRKIITGKAPTSPHCPEGIGIMLAVWKA